MGSDVLLFKCLFLDLDVEISTNFLMIIHICGCFDVPSFLYKSLKLETK